ncbi:ribonuclease domain-containing protein [Nocardioides piscis]|uniref:Uncharacterized protein n=1 Tax=Nocardioides piscis TaxID=2714938 RepID=A0A6G7YJD7_9ACTN|nr:ribonuclease domain-containing protein [Nocardioides piscis]QIK76852.1 hypothetical protein G7071_16865 [Nocardioides piscis]
MPARRTVVGLVALITAGLVWWTQGDGATPETAPSERDTPSVQQSPSSPTGAASSSQPDRGTGTDPDSGLPRVALADLPPEAAETLALIDAGGPYPYAEDDGVFGNFEGILPDHERGYYREYTVDTPGLSHRGARRIVAGSADELYWTDDHYSSFSRIVR